MRVLLLAATALILGACNNSLEVLSARQAQPVVVRAGTSFGECLGYCITELEIADAEAVFTRRGWDVERYPPRTRRRELPREEWEALLAAADLEAFSRLREVYGCPDCADGGAEWIELESDGSRRRVTFEHGDTIPEIAPLILGVREIRERFGER